jgi:capsular polysaccharide transport system permease protein
LIEAETWQMSNADNRKDFTLADALGLDGELPADRNRRWRRSGRQAEAEDKAGGQERASSDGRESAESAAGVVDARARREPARRERRQIEPSPDSRHQLPSVDVAEVPSLVMLPQRRRRASWGGIVSFFLCVVLPTIGAAIYYLEIASNQYVVQWRFTIENTTTGSGASGPSSGWAALLGANSGTVAGPDNYVVTEYITSEQAVDDLEKRIGVRALYSKPSIDYWSRADASLPVEQFTRYWQRMVTASFDQVTGTAFAEVRAFTPQDAYLIATTLVSLTENLLNKTSQRPLLEAVRFAEGEVARARQRLDEIRVELADYRNKAAVIDPNSSIVLSNATVASTLRQTIAQYQADLGSALRGGLGPNASQVEVLKRRITATQDQLKDVESEIAKTKQGNRPLSEVVGRYEELELEKQFAQALVTSTIQSLEQARANAMAKRLFIIPYVQPTMPQSSTYPNRVVSIAIVAGACVLLWTIGLLLARSIREHLA